MIASVISHEKYEKLTANLEEIMLPNYNQITLSKGKDGTIYLKLEDNEFGQEDTWMKIV